METKMPNNWKKYKLHQVAEIKYGKDHKLLKSGSIPVYGSGGIMRYGDNFLYDKPSILIPRKGTLSNLFYVDKPFWSVDTMFWSKIEEGTLPKYLFYNLKTLDFASMDVGSAVPSLTTELLNRIDITLPSLPEQQAIAEILSSLDDKIELNLQTNKTLEEMANALYKHWFVDFGPFKTGKFIESELGMIPEGWEVKPFYQIAKYINGTSIKQNQITEPNKGRPIVKIAELKQGITEQTKWSNVNFDSRYIFNTSDLLFSWSGNPHTSIDVFIWDKMESILNQHIFKVVPELHLEKPFVFFSLKYYMETFITLATRKQTTGLGHFTNEDLKNNYIIVPSISVHENYNSIAANYFELIYKNLIENQTLKQTRDYLLPKLISGEIQVKQAAKLVKQVL